MNGFKLVNLLWRYFSISLTKDNSVEWVQVPEKSVKIANVDARSANTKQIFAACRLPYIGG